MCRRRTAILLSILCLTFCAATIDTAAETKQQRKEARKQIERLEAQWRDAAIKNDVGVLDRLLADDYVGIGANGMFQTKQQLLASRASGKVHFDKIEYNDTKIRIYGDTAVVTTTAEIQARSEANGDFSGKYRYTRVYTRHHGASWRIVSFESSRVTPQHSKN